MGDTAAFDCIAEHLDYPMFVVGAAADDDADACLIGFGTQCSIDPLRFAAFLSKQNHTYELACRASVLVVHRLRADQHDVAEHFGGTSEKDDPSKLADWSWRRGPEGVPILDDCDWFAGRLVSTFDAGDHVAFVLSPFDGECHRQSQLDFQAARDIEAGQPA